MKPNICSVGIYCRRLLLPFPNILEGIAHHLDKDLLARRTFNLILSYLQIELTIGDRLITIRTTIRKFLNHLLFRFSLHISWNLSPAPNTYHLSPITLF